MFRLVAGQQGSGRHDQAATLEIEDGYESFREGNQKRVPDRWRDGQEVACAEVLDGRDSTECLTCLILRQQSQEIDLIELVLVGWRQTGPVDVELGPGQGGSAVAVGETHDPGHQHVVPERPKRRDRKGSPPVLGPQGSVVRDRSRDGRVGFDTDLASNALSCP